MSTTANSSAEYKGPSSMRMSSIDPETMIRCLGDLPGLTLQTSKDDQVLTHSFTAFWVENRCQFSC